MSEVDEPKIDVVLQNQQVIISMLKKSETNSVKRWKLSYGLAAMLASLAINSFSHGVAVAVFILGVLFVVLSPVELKKIDDFISGLNNY
jgi:hypothetical protein